MAFAPLCWDRNRTKLAGSSLLMCEPVFVSATRSSRKARGWIVVWCFVPAAMRRNAVSLAFHFHFQGPSQPGVGVHKAAGTASRTANQTRLRSIGDPKLGVGLSLNLSLLRIPKRKWVVRLAGDQPIESAGGLGRKKVEWQLDLECDSLAVLPSPSSHHIVHPRGKVKRQHVGSTIHGGFAAGASAQQIHRHHQRRHREVVSTRCLRCASRVSARWL